MIGNVTGFTFPSGSTFQAIGGVRFGWIGYNAIYAIDGNVLRSGQYFTFVYSIGSSRPAVYTLAAGDEWGDLVLIHFRVVAS